jgi:hypothetical protein
MQKGCTVTASSSRHTADLTKLAAGVDASEEERILFEAGLGRESSDGSSSSSSVF